jgi:hypothetical protein
LLLGVLIKRDQTAGVTRLSQEHYIDEILEEFNMTGCNPVSTPMNHAVKLTAEMSPSSDEEKARMAKVPYRQAVGKLIYLAGWTRPDISLAVSVCSRFLENPGVPHWNAVKHIMRYLKGTREFCLTLAPQNLDITVYSDADWAGDLGKRRSTSGYLVFVGNSLIAWKTKLQSGVALSTMEAEFYALSFAIQEMTWIRRVMGELGYGTKVPMVYEDNQSCIAYVKNAKMNSQVKHIDIKLRFVQDLYEKKSFALEYVPSNAMRADIMTKPLGPVIHKRLTPLLNVQLQEEC